MGVGVGVQVCGCACVGVSEHVGLWTGVHVLFGVAFVCGPRVVWLKRGKQGGYAMEKAVVVCYMYRRAEDLENLPRDLLEPVVALN